ncbi:[FeFe] hydrogenase H-cluster radical SAM maturase HydG [Acididesulfobacillus acetoxydans]|nr:[FeFe] hydrogenase H-cluster radical SAM maturase HydG [Acididesulfobacillus acetoxydans]
MEQKNPLFDASFIDEDRINRLLAEARRQSASSAPAHLLAVIDRAREAEGLSLEETAQLLFCEDDAVLGELFRTAGAIKQKIYGRRMVFFAPLYLSSFCINNCLYCGYRRDNKFERHRLTLDEIEAEIRALERMGHKRLALECGEDPGECDLDYLEKAISAIYRVREGNGRIRRVNVNIAATSVENYRRLKKAQIGTYILFQETYHRETYSQVHPSGPKRDYDYHTTAHHRAMSAGIDDVGLGVLFGLYDYHFEVLALLSHAQALEKSFGVGPHTLSVPRLRPAAGVDLRTFPHLVTDRDLKKIVAVLRLAVPYTGLIISTREEPALRDELFALGISQLSAGSSTDVGGYASAGSAQSSPAAPQFQLSDRRSPDEVIADLCQKGFLPSFCTACYRQGRTGDHFMPLAKSGSIQNMCQPNAILTFKEYLLDYASPAVRSLGEETIAQHLARIPLAKTRAETEARLERLVQGERDLYF